MSGFTRQAMRAAVQNFDPADGAGGKRIVVGPGHDDQLCRVKTAQRRVEDARIGHKLKATVMPGKKTRLVKQQTPRPPAGWMPLPSKVKAMHHRLVSVDAIAQPTSLKHHPARGTIPDTSRLGRSDRRQRRGIRAQDAGRGQDIKPGLQSLGPGQRRR